jgi:hypothetical protein
MKKVEPTRIDEMNREAVTSIGAALGTLLGVLNTGWIFWKAYRDRARLSVEVDWEWSGMYDPEDEPSPRVTIINIGGRMVSIAGIYLDQAGRRVCTFEQLENSELNPDRSNISRLRWDEEPGNEPEFDHGWKGLRVVICAESGKEWRSKPPKTKPSWLAMLERKPAIPPGLAR